VSGAPLPVRLSDHLARTRLLAEPGLALLAVSGGPDSMALLDLLAGVAPGLGLTLHLVHADHGIHPRAAEIAAMVAETALKRYGLETDVAHLELGAEASETHARTARYTFFRYIQRRRRARYLATAHHADDQAETVLLRLLRGSAPIGLAGIPAHGPAGLVRPLLPFRRADLAAHVAEAGLPVFTDPANEDPRHMRSWVRTALLPTIETRLGAQAMDALLDVARHAADEAAAWDALLAVLPGLDVKAAVGVADVARGVLAGYDKPLAVRVLRAVARRAGLRLGPRAANRVAEFLQGALSGRRIDLGAGLTAEVAFERLVLTDAVVVPPAPVALTGPEGEATFGDHRLRWRTEAAPERLERAGWTTWLVSGSLAVRIPEPGESLVPLGGVGHREVRRLLMEARVPRWVRMAQPLVTWNGAAAWLPGVCRAEAGVPDPGTVAVRIDVTAG
jgi:tRNA(Ile)-lysidine synthase